MRRSSCADQHMELRPSTLGKLNAPVRHRGDEVQCDVYCGWSSIYGTALAHDQNVMAAVELMRLHSGTPSREEEHQARAYAH